MYPAWFPLSVLLISVSLSLPALAAGSLPCFMGYGGSLNSPEGESLRKELDRYLETLDRGAGYFSSFGDVQARLSEEKAVTTSLGILAMAPEWIDQLDLLRSTLLPYSWIAANTLARTSYEGAWGAKINLALRDFISRYADRQVPEGSFLEETLMNAELGLARHGAESNELRWTRRMISRGLTDSILAMLLGSKTLSDPTSAPVLQLLREHLNSSQLSTAAKEEAVIAFRRRLFRVTIPARPSEGLDLIIAIHPVHFRELKEILESYSSLEVLYPRYFRNGLEGKILPAEKERVLQLDSKVRRALLDIWGVIRM